MAGTSPWYTPAKPSCRIMLRKTCIAPNRRFGCCPPAAIAPAAAAVALRWGCSLTCNLTFTTSKGRSSAVLTIPEDTPATKGAIEWVSRMLLFDLEDLEEEDLEEEDTDIINIYNCKSERAVALVNEEWGRASFLREWTESYDEEEEGVRTHCCESHSMESRMIKQKQVWAQSVPDWKPASAGRTGSREP